MSERIEWLQMASHPPQPVILSEAKNPSWILQPRCGFRMTHLQADASIIHDMVVRQVALELAAQALGIVEEGVARVRITATAEQLARAKS